MTEPHYFPWIHRLAWASLVVSVLLTIGLGGAVTSAEVGMAYPTWPDMNGASLFNFFYGELADEFGAGANLEHTHRQAGTLIGLLCIGMVLATLFTKGVPAAWKKLSIGILLLVIVQGLLGAFRVTENAQATGIIHAVGAQLVVVAIVAMIQHSSKPWCLDRAMVRSAEAARLRLWSLVAIVALFLNLVAAASLRHKEAAFGGHFVLALTASAVLLGVVWLVARHFPKHPALWRQARWLANLLGMQLGLGLGTWAFIWGPMAGRLESEKARFLSQAGFATAHLLVGVCVLAVVTAIYLEAKHRLLPETAGGASATDASGGSAAA